MTQQTVTQQGLTHETVADLAEPMVASILGTPPPVRIEFWDGSSIGSDDGTGTLHIRSPHALRRIVWAPGELGFARAFVMNDADITGELPEVLRALQTSMPEQIGVGLSAFPSTLAAVRRLGALGRPLPPPPEEATVRGRRHSIRRDEQVVSHHYDVGNEFYRLLLGPALTYSCARFVTPDTALDEAQAAKHDLICRKLGLAEPGFRERCPGERPRLLDIGCGWGSMAIHAARHHDADVVAVTISAEQAALARERVADLGLDDRIEIRIQDYREIGDGPFDAVSSIGMAEHVGRAHMDEYVAAVYGLVRPGGRFMNHAIASFGGSRLGRRSFVGRYIFPDGELLDLADTVSAIHGSGFEVRDVENLREHYAETLRRWLHNLEHGWDHAVELVGARRARAWRLYIAASINGFDDAGLQLYQTLAVRSTAEGDSGFAPTRGHWETSTDVSS